MLLNKSNLQNFQLNFEINSITLKMRNLLSWMASLTLHTVAIWTFPFHQNAGKNSDDFLDLTLAQ